MSKMQTHSLRASPKSDSTTGPDSLIRAIKKSEYIDDSISVGSTAYHFIVRRSTSGEYFQEGWSSKLHVQFLRANDPIWQYNDQATTIASRIEILKRGFISMGNSAVPMPYILYQHCIDGLDPDSLILIVYKDKPLEISGMIPKAMGDEDRYTYHPVKGGKPEKAIADTMNGIWKGYLRNRLAQDSIDVSILR